MGTSVAVVAMLARCFILMTIPVVRILTVGCTVCPTINDIPEEVADFVEPNVPMVTAANPFLHRGYVLSLVGSKNDQPLSRLVVFRSLTLIGDAVRQLKPHLAPTRTAKPDV